MTNRILTGEKVVTPFGTVEISYLTDLIAGHRICIYDLGGKEDGPIAVIGPGFSYGGIIFITLALALGGHYRVFSFDPPYHGRTRAIDDTIDCSWTEFAIVLAAIVDELQPERLILHSMQPSAMCLHSELFNKPGLIISAIDPILSPDRERAQKLADYCAKLPATFRSLAEAREHWTTEPFRVAGYAGFPPELLDLYLQQNTASLSTHDDDVRLLLPPTIEAQMYAARPHSDNVIAGVRRLFQPFQLIYPMTRRKGEDPAVQLRLAEELVNNARGLSQLVAIEGGHNVPMVNPELVAKTILDFRL